MKAFTTHLTNENWESVLSNHDIVSKFNTFLNIILRTSETSFPTKREVKVFNNNEWVTSCKHKTKCLPKYLIE